MNIPEVKALCHFQNGESVRITRLEIDGVMRRRLLDLGFVPGSVVRVVSKSPLGDPIAFRVSSTTVALRKEESAKIFAESLQ